MGKRDFCCAEGCSHARHRNATCAFYKFPTDSKLRSVWVNKISRVEKVSIKGKPTTKQWQPSSSSKLCSCHFENPKESSVTRKKWHEIPMIFSHRSSTKPSPRTFKERQPFSPLYIATPLNRNTHFEKENDVLDTGAQCLESIYPLADEVNIDNRDSSPDATLDETSEVPQPQDHDYIVTEQCEASYHILRDNPDLFVLLDGAEKNQMKAEKLEQLNTSGQNLKLDNIKDNPKLFQYYTGLSYDVFVALYKYLEPKATDMKYPHGSRTVLFSHHAERGKKQEAQEGLWTLYWLLIRFMYKGP